MVYILMLVNLVISFFNARSCGQVWAESKAVGGWIRTVVWAGAIMAAVGFTSVYVILICLIAESTGYLPPESVGFLSALTYIMLIVPAIGAGVVITINSWISFAREKSLMNLGLAGWNTFAQAYNMYNAVNSFGGAWDMVARGFGSIPDELDDDSSSSNTKVVLIALLALFGGVLTTMVIIKKYASTLPVSEEIRQSSKAGTRDLAYR